MALLASFFGIYLVNLILQVIIFPLTFYIMRKQYDITIKRNALILPFFASAFLATVLAMLSGDIVGIVGHLLYPVASAAAAIYYANSKASKQAS